MYTCTVSVQVLSITRCSLTDLNGFIALPALCEVYAAYNEVSILEPIMDAPNLEVLDLEGNELEDTDQLGFIGACEALQHINFAYNPVSTSPSYLSAVLDSAPSTLRTFDDHLLPWDDTPSPNDDLSGRNLAGSSAQQMGCARKLTSERMDEQVALVIQGLKRARFGSDNVPSARTSCSASAESSEVCRENYLSRQSSSRCCSSYCRYLSSTFA
jgi:hypothetical protein